MTDRTNRSDFIQYELVWKNIEYLDAGIFKIVGFYGVLESIFLANIEKFYEKPYSATVLIIVISLIFILLLSRTADLASAQLKKLKKLENKITVVYPETTISNAFPCKYGEGMKTSVISMIGILIMSVTTIASIILEAKF